MFAGSSCTHHTSRAFGYVATVVRMSSSGHGYSCSTRTTAAGAPSYNLFGIKAGPGWQGRTVQVTTTEYDGGVARQTVQSFRAYDGYAAAFQDWALAIGRNQRYSAAVTAAGDAGGFAFGMQQAGYSTDPAYAEKLARVIRTASSIAGTG